MSIVEIFLIGIALSMDAFAVSISNGLVIKPVTLKKALLIALTYGVYQFLMPVAGYVGASFFYRFIASIDHWIAFALLSFLGGKMIIETVHEMKAKSATADTERHSELASKTEPTPAEKNDNAPGNSAKISFLSFKTLMIQGIATSIDALAVGISLAAMPVPRPTYAETLLASAVYPALLIGLTTTCLCLPAVFIGKKTGDRLGDKAQLLGGAILVAIGVKILIEHVFFGG